MARNRSISIESKERRDAELMRVYEAAWNTREVLELHRHVEENWAHGGVGEENVCVHTMRVVDEVIKLVSGQKAVFEDVALQQKLEAFFDDERKLAQTLVAILHDVGKGAVGGITINPDGTTSAAGHEGKSADLMPEVFAQLRERSGVTLSRTYEAAVTFIVAHHGDVYGLLLFDEPKGQRTEPLEVRMDRVLGEKGVTMVEHKIAILMNALGDLAAGRIDGKKFEGMPSGFTAEHRARTKQLLAYYVAQLPTEPLR